MGQLFGDGVPDVVGGAADHDRHPKAAASVGWSPARPAGAGQQQRATGIRMASCLGHLVHDPRTARPAKTNIRMPSAVPALLHDGGGDQPGQHGEHQGVSETT